MKSTKHCHLSPELRAIFAELDETSQQFRELSNLVHTVQREQLDYRNDKESKLQTTDITAKLYSVHTKPEDVRGKKRRRMDPANNSQYKANISDGGDFSFSSSWERDYHNEITTTATLMVDEETIIQYEAYALTINWQNLAHVKQALGTEVKLEHLLEFLRCCAYCSTARRVDTTKWKLPTTCPAEGGVQEILDGVKENPKVPTTGNMIPTNEDDAILKMEKIENKLETDLINFCARVTTTTLPVELKEVYVHVSRVERKELKHYNHLVAEVVCVVVGNEGGDPSTIQQTPECVILQPILNTFAENLEYYTVYKQYDNILEYLPVLLDKKGISQPDVNRLMPIYTPWLKGVTWSDMSKNRKSTYAWDPCNVVSRIGHSHFHLQVTLQTTVPLFNIAKKTRSHSQDKLFTKLCGAHMDIQQTTKIVREVIAPVAREARAVEVEEAKAR